jgi:hypothetical protein
MLNIVRAALVLFYAAAPILLAQLGHMATREHNPLAWIFLVAFILTLSQLWAALCWLKARPARKES